MNSEILKLLELKQFFTLLHLKNNTAKFSLKEPSQLLIKNIHSNWLQYNFDKSSKHNLPVYLKENIFKLEHVPSVFGTIKQELQEYDENSVLQLNFCDCAPLIKSELKLNLNVPQQLAMQYFIQWQRYRKFWWSSISTTPSLFTVNEFKYENSKAHVDIVAQFPSGHLPVEKLSFQAKRNEENCNLSFSMCLEDALFILLLDGLSNSMKKDYLRLHRKIAPYKISFALYADIKDSVNMYTLRKLARLLHHKLQLKRISSWLPDFDLDFDMQIEENLRMGVTYTAVLDEDTLTSGVFKLMNSSTKLMERVHIADFHKYAALIFNKN